MENHQILAKSKLGFSASFREAFKILFNHPNFISLVLISSFPLFASLLAHHILLHPTFIQLLKLLSEENPSDPSPRYIIRCRLDGSTACISQRSSDDNNFKATLSHKFLISTLISSALIFFLDLLSTISTVSISAAIYGGNSQMGFKQMLVEVRKRVAVRLRGSLATSLYALILASLTLLGLIALSTNMFLMPKSSFIFGTIFVFLLTKFIEWSAIWNMGIVISILDKNHGYIAIGVAAYLSRGRRKLGLSLMLVFFALKVALGLPCLYALWNQGSCGALGNVVSVSFKCVGDILMWIVLMVYFYDCKRQFLEKKIDLENNGKAIEATQQ
ncbi:uncharacterized protein LOC111785557 [Cucurbita pepo subsp. pepo]|uniref:uncharacterized protein LOC111785557 n=1 Tax=Cucurbita pepo subsp. pepo TaxID=3664 RepID=UPI000C9D6706|nr:uncharacterized protein LOC111785557 [Cucurbita pepo subsp. pepo]